MPKVRVEGRDEIYRFPDDTPREEIARQIRGHLFPRQERDPARTAARVGSAAGFLAPGTGIADVIGAYPTGEGTNYPSLVQNILRGNFADAGFQALGAVGDMAYASAPLTGPIGVGIGMAAKVPRAARVAANYTVRRDSAGFYSLTNPLTGEQASVVRNTDLPGPDKWIAYATSGGGGSTDPLPTKREAMLYATRMLDESAARAAARAGIEATAPTVRGARSTQPAVNEAMASLGDDFRIVAEATARAENPADRALLRTFEEYSTNPTLYGNMARNGHVQTVLDMFSPGFQGQQRYAKRSVSSGAGIADVPMKDLKAADEAGYLMYFSDGERGQDIVISPEGHRRLQQILERNR